MPSSVSSASSVGRDVLLDAVRGAARELTVVTMSSPRPDGEAGPGPVESVTASVDWESAPAVREALSRVGGVLVGEEAGELRFLDLQLTVRSAAPFSIAALVVAHSACVWDEQLRASGSLVLSARFGLVSPAWSLAEALASTPSLGSALEDVASFRLSALRFGEVPVVLPHEQMLAALLVDACSGPGDLLASRRHLIAVKLLVDVLRQSPELPRVAAALESLEGAPAASPVDASSSTGLVVDAPVGGVSPASGLRVRPQSQSQSQSQPLPRPGVAADRLPGGFL
jgi:hypothetical protein